MSGLLAVIANDGRALGPVIDSLASAYDTVRPGGRRHDAPALSFARVVQVDTDASAHPGIEQIDGGFVASCGVVRGLRTAIHTPLAELDGQFALARFDARDGALTVATDPFGMHPLFRSEYRGATCISSSALALARHLGAPIDPLGLAVFVACGHQVGSITNWRGIERIPPAAELTFEASGSRSRQYWRPQVDPGAGSLTFQATVDRMIEIATAALAQTLAGQPRVWADVTGGFDSRLLNLLLARAGIDAIRNTVGDPASADVRIGEALARTAGWPWVGFETEPDWPKQLPAYVVHALGWADGRLPVLNLAHVVRVHERQGVRHRGHLGGSGGEVLGGSTWAHEFLRAGRSTRLNYDNLIGMRLFASGAQAVLRPDVDAQVRQYLRETIDRIAGPYALEPNTRQLDVTYAASAASWEGAFAAASGRDLRSELPFYLRDVYCAAFSTPHPYRRHRRLQRAMIERLSPSIAALPTPRGGSAQPMGLRLALRQAPFYASLGWRAVGKLAQTRLGVQLPSGRIVEADALRAGRRAAVAELSIAPRSAASASLYAAGFLETILHPDGAPLGEVDNRLDRVITAELIARGS